MDGREAWYEEHRERKGGLEKVCLCNALQHAAGREKQRGGRSGMMSSKCDQLLAGIDSATLLRDNGDLTVNGSVSN